MKNEQKNNLLEIAKKLREYKPLLKKDFKVRELGIFGSYLRAEQKRASDLDILVEFSEPIGLFAFIELEYFLSHKLGIKVDLVMKNALKPRIKERVIQEALYV